jgi:hypothetical protein
LAQLIAERPTAVYLNPDALDENKSNRIDLVNSSAGLKGKCHELLGNNASLAIRQRILGESHKDFFNEEAKKYSEDVSIENGTIDSLKNYDYPVEVSYDLNVNLKNDDRIYFTPMLNEQLKQNPFSSQNRRYPVEMPYRSITTYDLKMEVPTGYQVEELPKSQALVLPGNKARFDYQLTQSGTQIHLQSRLQMSKTFFPIAEYENLRSFIA